MNSDPHRSLSDGGGAHHTRAAGMPVVVAVNRFRGPPRGGDRTNVLLRVLGRPGAVRFRDRHPGAALLSSRGNNVSADFDHATLRIRRTPFIEGNSRLAEEAQLIVLVGHATGRRYQLTDEFELGRGPLSPLEILDDG